MHFKIESSPLFPSTSRAVEDFKQIWTILDHLPATPHKSPTPEKFDAIFMGRQSWRDVSILTAREGTFSKVIQKGLRLGHVLKTGCQPPSPSLLRIHLRRKRRMQLQSLGWGAEPTG